ncbi:hypothetical protein ACLOJK_039231 [Asimina triloba]
MRGIDESGGTGILVGVVKSVMYYQDPIRHGHQDPKGHFVNMYTKQTWDRHAIRNVVLGIKNPIGENRNPNARRGNGKGNGLALRIEARGQENLVWCLGETSGRSIDRTVPSHITRRGILRVQEERRVMVRHRVVDGGRLTLWGLFGPSSADVVHGKDILSAISDLVFLSLPPFTMALKKVTRATSIPKIGEEQSVLPQHEEGSSLPPQDSPHNAAADAVNLPLGSPQVAPDQPDMGVDNLVTRAEFHILACPLHRKDISKLGGLPAMSFIEEMNDIYPMVDSAPMALIGAANHFKALPNSTIRCPQSEPMTLPTPSFHLQMQPIINKFEVLGMPVFGPTLDPTRHVVNYSMHMDLCTASKGLKCRAFPATLNEQEKMWFASLALGSITGFKQLTDLFEARFNNQQ